MLMSVEAGLPKWLRGKESTCNAQDAGDMGSIPGLGTSPGGRQGNPLQNSCLENHTHKGAWRATVHGVTNSRTRLKRLSEPKEKQLDCLRRG